MTSWLMAYNYLARPTPHSRLGPTIPLSRPDQPLQLRMYLRAEDCLEDKSCRTI